MGTNYEIVTVDAPTINAQQAAFVDNIRASLTTNAAKKRDPTNTTVLRKKYSQQYTKRFAALKGLINETVVKNDALALKKRGGGGYVGQARGGQQRANLPSLTTQAKRTKAAKKFQFTTDAGKVDAFMQWLNLAINSEVLEIVAFDGGRVSDRNDWQGSYIRDAYIRGVVKADTIAKRAGFDIPDPTQSTVLNLVFNNPIHADTLKLLTTRQFELLQNITSTMSTQIGQILAAGIAQGVTNKEIAKRINDRVNKIGITRAKLIARTEIINAYAESTLNRYSDYGFAGVTALVEFATADDDRVCEKCEKLDDKNYTIKQARGVIPVHPNCRCAWIPVLDV